MKKLMQSIKNKTIYILILIVLSIGILGYFILLNKGSVKKADINIEKDYSYDSEYLTFDSSFYKYSFKYPSSWYFMPFDESEDLLSGHIVNNYAFSNTEFLVEVELIIKDISLNDSLLNKVKDYSKESSELRDIYIDGIMADKCFKDMGKDKYSYAYFVKNEDIVLLIKIDVERLNSKKSFYDSKEWLVVEEIVKNFHFISE